MNGTEKPPIVDSPDQPPAPAVGHLPWWRWAIVCLGIHAALLGVIFTGILGERRDFVTYVLGLFAGQITCLAAWAVYGPGGIFMRVPGAIFVGVGLWFIFAAGMDLEHRDTQTPILTAILALGHLALVAGGLAILRLYIPGGFEFAVSIDDKGLPPPAPTAASASKFSLLHLMGWTTAIAILCAIGVRVFQHRMEDFLEDVREIVPIVTITAASAAVGVIQVVALLREERRLTNLLLAYLSVPVIAMVELTILTAIEEANNRPLDDLLEMAVMLLLKNTIHALVVSLTFGLFYVAGLRWVDSNAKQWPAYGGDR